MANKIIQGVQQAARGMSLTEGLLKLAIAMFFIPLPILAGGLGGFWLDYYRLNTLPLLLVVGTLLGTIVSFLGVCGIIIFSHKGGIR